MLRVSTYNLSEDFKNASTDYGVRELGEVTPEDVEAVLEWFLLLDPVLNMEADPFITIEGPGGKVTVRVSAGHLFMHQARTAELGSMEVDIPGLLRLVLSSGLRPTAPAEVEQPQQIEPRKRDSQLNQGIALTMLVLGLALNGFTIYSAFYIDSIHKDPPITLITDSDDAQEKQHAIAGIYATGNEPGDRILTLLPEGKIKIQELGTKGKIRRNLACSFLPGTRNGRLHLRLRPHGYVEVINRDTLIYYGDTYHRKE